MFFGLKRELNLSENTVILKHSSVMTNSENYGIKLTYINTMGIL